MNVLIDGRTFCRYAAGITTFLHCSLNEWVKQSPEDVFYVLLPKVLDEKIQFSEAKNLRLLDYSNKLTRKMPNIVILQFLVPYLCKKYNIDIYFSPVPHLPFFIPSKAKKLIAVHDVVNIEFQQTMSFTNRMASKFFFGYAVNKADYIWYNSNYTKEKIHFYFSRKRCKKEIVGLSTDDKYFNIETPDSEVLESLIRKYDISKKYILFVGSLEPRKNLSFLLKLAPELYSDYNLKLVVVGANKWKNSGISDIVNSESFNRESVVFCGYVSNEELSALYHGARCFVSTSLNEGFGLPQLEALKCGCPIVTANNSAMSEIASGKRGAYLVDGYDPKIWIKTISSIAVQHPSVNQEQLSLYSWIRIIKEVRQCLSE